MPKLRSRALHARQHVGVEGRLEVGELPAHLRVAVFAQPRTWPVYVRFSNGAPRKQRDPVPDVRGIALKLRGVPGRKLIRGLEDKKTQDFLLIQSPATPFRTPDEFVAFLRVAAKGQALMVPRLLGELVLPQQRIDPGLEERVEKLSFDPWHAVEELRPLGAMMRARAPAYRESVIARGAAAEPEE